MFEFRTSLLSIPLLAALAGCSTVAVFQPATSVISLTQEQSVLHDASDAYCEEVRAKGLATGEASLGSLAAVLTGRAGDGDAYWRNISSEGAASFAVMQRIRTDRDGAAEGLAALNVMAREMMREAKPSRTDVTRFELALIHARQARNSLQYALSQASETVGPGVEIAAELAPLDQALAAARITADDLAAARTSDDMARLDVRS